VKQESPKEKLSAGDVAGVICPECKHKGFGLVNDDSKSVKVADHLSLDRTSQCDGVGDDVPI
jgi:hypothetical protein